MNEKLPTSVVIADIIMDERIRVRKINHQTMRKYAQAYELGERLPPVDIIQEKGTGILYLWDGWHRVEALKDLGRVSVEAYTEEGTFQDAQRRAATANLDHGKPLSGEEKKNAFILFMESGAFLIREGRRTYKKSYREIVEEFKGVISKSSISRWMKTKPRLQKIHRKWYQDEQPKPTEDYIKLNAARREANAGKNIEKTKQALIDAFTYFQEIPGIADKEALLKAAQKTVKSMKKILRVPYDRDAIESRRRMEVAQVRRDLIIEMKDLPFQGNDDDDDDNTEF